MNEELRQRVIETLRQGKDLPAEWARELFPPEKREYELVYHGKEREEDIIADTMAVPLQPVRTFGKNGDDWHNMLIFGDNLQVMKTLLEQKKAGKLCNADGTPGVRLIYIDPPFATKKEFSGSQDQKAYQDKVAGAKFLEFLRKRLVFLRELLSDDGSIYVHLDYRKAHYIKVLMDEMFNESRFENEIVWHYPDNFQGNINRFPNNHNTIYLYSRSDHTRFKRVAIPLKGGKRKRDVRIWDPETQNLTAARNENGDIIYKEFTHKWADDVWDIGQSSVTKKKSGEYLGYPTQKPEELLRRVIEASTISGDIILDAFAGSGTTCAVAEKFGRRWIGIDCGKLAIYTIQKRMLNLKKEIGNKGKPLEPKPFTLYNAGLYNFSELRKLPWTGWRFYALQLFGCKDEPHTIGGLKLDGKLKGASVLVFNHQEHQGQRIDEDTVRDIHNAVGRKIGSKFFIIAPRGVFDFQQDYIDFDGIRYYALRIPYSIINELHHREFRAIKQPNDETAVNDTVDAVGFDFIQTPRVKWAVSVKKRQGQSQNQACLKIKQFESRARLRGQDTRGGLETLSVLMLDFDYDGKVFDFDAVFYAHQLQADDWQAWFSIDGLGGNTMVVFIDIYGNEAREIIPCDKSGFMRSKPGKAKTKKRKSGDKYACQP